MTIYVDSLFVLNFMINYLLLLGSARLAGVQMRRWRMALAAALGGGFAVATVVPGLEFFTAPGMKAFMLALMILAAFGCNRAAVKQGALFLGLSFAFCGVVMGVVMLLGNGLMLINGAAYYPVSAKALILTGAGVYVAAWLIFSRIGEHHGGDLVPAYLRLGERNVTIQALRDTGNTLKDPISNQPVMVAEWTVLRDLLPERLQADVSQQALGQPAQLMQQLSDELPQLRCRLIPYRAVGVSTGLLLAVKCDELQLNRKPVPAALVAFSPTPVSDGGGYLALTGGV